MEVTAFIIELSAEVVKGIQGGNECWMGNNEKLRGEGRRDGCAFERVGADAKQQSVHLKARVLVRGEGLLSFYNGCGDGEVRCNGRGKPAPLRKARGIVRKISLMVQMGSNPHHSWLGLTEQQNLTLFRVEARVIVQGNGIVVLLQWLWEWRGSVRRKAIPPVVARIFVGDSTSPLTRDGHGCPKLNAQSFKHGCLKSATQSRYARMHKDSHTKPLHDATAQMAVDAQMQRHKWLSMHRCNGTNG